MFRGTVFVSVAGKRREGARRRRAPGPYHEVSVFRGTVRSSCVASGESLISRVLPGFSNANVGKNDRFVS